MYLLSNYHICSKSSKSLCIHCIFQLYHILHKEHILHITNDHWLENLAASGTLRQDVLCKVQVFQRNQSQVFSLPLLPYFTTNKRRFLKSNTLLRRLSGTV